MPKIIIASGPVIVENNKVLLDISGNDNFWKFCGGKTEENKNLEETAIIRAKEELGIDIKIINPEPFLMSIKKPGDENIDVLLIHYLAERKGEIVKGDGVEEFVWYDIDNLPENLAPNIIPTLKHFEFIK